MSIPWGTGLPTIKVFSDATQATLQKTLYLPPCDKRGVTLSWRKKYIAQDLVDGSERQRVLGYIPVLNLRWKHFNDTDHRGLGFGQNDGNMLTLADLQEILALSPGRLRVSPGLSRATRTATHQPFFTGDGVTQSAQLMGLVDGRLVPAKRSLTATIYRTDWQGRQLMYPTARTNLLTSSGLLTDTNWTSWGAGTCIGGILDPLGGYGAFQVDMPANYTGWHHVDTAKSAGPTYTGSIQIRSDAPGTVIFFDGNGTSFKSLLTVTTSWKRYESSAVSSDIIPAQFGFYRDPTSSLSRVYVYAPQFEQNTLATSYIPTTTVPVTITDYTLSGTGLFLPSPVPAAGSVFDWSGTFSDAAIGFAANVTKHPDYRPVVAGLGGDVEVEFAGRDILSSPVLADF